MFEPAPLPDNLVERLNNNDSIQPSTSLAKGKNKEGMTSQYVGVTLKKATGLWKAAIKVKGYSHDLGYYAEEESAARAYDMAYICVRGLVENKLNFPATDYSTHAQMLTNMEIDDLAKQLRTQAGSTGTRQEKSTKYQGIRGKHSGGSGGKWEAIIRVAGKSVYLGIYDTEKEAAHAYDQGAILRWAQGVGATSHTDSSTTQPSLNFPLDSYQHLLADNDNSNSNVAPAAVGEGNNTLGNRDDAPPLLGKRYAEAVLQVCRQFHATCEALKNALS